MQSLTPLHSCRTSSHLHALCIVIAEAAEKKLARDDMDFDAIEAALGTDRAPRREEEETPARRQSESTKQDDLSSMTVEADTKISPLFNAVAGDRVHR